MQISASGDLMDPVSSPYFLLDERVAGNVSNVPSTDIYPKIVTPLYTYTLHEVFPLLKALMQHT